MLHRSAHTRNRNILLEDGVAWDGAKCCETLQQLPLFMVDKAKLDHFVEFNFDITVAFQFSSDPPIFKFLVRAIISTSGIFRFRAISLLEEQDTHEYVTRHVIRYSIHKTHNAF